MPDATMPVDSAREITNRILTHYTKHARDLPWRSLPGTPAPDPYRVWLSEIMLQQTTVAAVKPYFESFTRLWPSVNDVARAIFWPARATSVIIWAGIFHLMKPHCWFFPALAAIPPLPSQQLHLASVRWLLTAM
jgi:A/G-specific adenine glycosylase